MDELVTRISKLRLESLDENWVEAIYYAVFLEYGDFPAEHSDVIRPHTVRANFLKIIDAVNNWMNADTDSEEEKSWAVLTSKIPHRKLLALIGFFIHQGTKNIANEDSRTGALISARVYIKLLTIPGFLAYNIYHSQLFAHSLACVGYPKLLYDKYEEQKSKSNKEDKSSKHDHIGSTKELTSQVNDVLKYLHCFVIDLNNMIKPLKLTPNDMNFEDILSNLIDVTGGDIVSKLNVDKIVLSQVSHTIYKVIDVLLHHPNDPESTDATAITIVFKCMLPKILAACLENKNGNNNAVASYVTYVAYLLINYKEPAFEALHVLLEHLCYHLEGLDHGEVRNARVSVVAGLMTMLPKKRHRKFVQWLITLSESAKCGHRNIALDLMEKLLTYAPDPNEKKNENEQSKEKNSMDTDDETTQDSSVGNTEQSNANENGNEEPPPEEPDLNESNENVVLQQPAITVPYWRLLSAVYERVNDASTGVRVRALVALTKCFDNHNPDMKQAMQELHGEGASSRLMAVAARGVCDERALVRRAAAALAHRLIAAAHHPPAPIDLGILVGLCRDASIVVRSAAIAALADMLADAPCDSLVDAFLLGPIHQLSDPETKVQEQVLSIIRKLLIERVSTYRPDGEDQLPWMLLAAIVKHDLKPHLDKACTLLANKTNCISVWLVDALSIYLGSGEGERALLVLVLLTSVAPHVQYSDVEFALQYYYKLADPEHNTDPRLSQLTLELLMEWTPYMREEQSAALRDDLVRHLTTGPDDGCRIARAYLAAQLDPDNLAWATELMQLSERAALAGGAVEEWVRAADLSLVAPQPPAPALLQRFLAAIRNPPTEWSEDSMGMCVAGAGRLCLRARAAAAAAAPALAALLHTAAPLHARLNCLLALFDICTRYTCIVEQQLGAISRCVEQQAPAELRRAAARGLTKQLLAGYLRLRPPLYYTYCALLCDEDHEVREPAEYYVTCCLTPATIFQHFVECIQHYNCDTTENLSFDSRQLIYDVMLQRLTIIQRLNAQCRLAREVLETAADHVDEGEELSPATRSVLLDTITVLVGPRMRLPTKKPQANANGDIPDIDELQERVTTNIVSQKMKHTVAEVVVPAVLRLHARVRRGGGQLAAYLVRLATDLLHDYRAEIEDVIETDSEMVEHINNFTETIGLEPITGNSRNLVTSSAPPDAETPRAPRRRAAPPPARTKRALRL